MPSTFTEWRSRCVRPPASASKPGKFQPFGDVVFNPVSVPPFFGVDLDAVELHAEVDVVAAGHPRLTALAHDLAALHQVALMHRDLAQVAVDTLQPIAVIDDDAISVNSQWGCIDYPAVVRRLDSHMLGD